MENNTPENTSIETNTTENQQAIIQKLLQEKQSNTRKTNKIDKLQSGKNISLSDMDMKKMRYKFFSLLLLVGSVIIWTYFVQPLLTQYIQNNKNLTTQKESIQQITQFIEIAQKQEQFAHTISKNKTELIECINNNTSCQKPVAKLLPYEKNTAKAQKKAQSYLQMGDLSDPKLLVDEKSILTNIDLFLLRFNKQNRIGDPFGSIKKITIGDPVHIENNIYSVSVETVINFANQEGLVQFLTNTEKRIIANDKIQLPPILYKIEEVSYDIAKYNESQDATIKLTAYYYKNIKKEKK